MRAIFAIFLATWSLVTVISDKNILYILPKCYLLKQNMSYCIEDSIHLMRQYLSTGVPELDIPSFKPYIIDEHKFHLTKVFKGTVTFQNIRIYGLTAYHIDKVQVTEDRSEIKFHVFFPIIEVFTHYTIDGVLHDLPVVRKYEMFAIYKNVTANIIINGEYYVNNHNRKKHFHVNSVFMSSRIAQTSMRNMKNNYPWNLADEELIYINDKWYYIIPELQPKIHEVALELIKTTANKIY